MEDYPQTEVPIEVQCYLDYFDFTDPLAVRDYFHVLHEASIAGDLTSQNLHEHFWNAMALYPEDSQQNLEAPRELYKAFAYSDHYNDRLMALNLLPNLWRYDNSSAVLDMLRHNLTVPFESEYDAILHEAAGVAVHRAAQVRSWTPARDSRVASLVMRRALRASDAAVC